MPPPADDHPPPAKQKKRKPEGDPNRFRVQCPKCYRMWNLRAEDVCLRSADSCGLYQAYLECPECHYVQDLLP